MAKEKIKISKNQVDKNPPLFANPADPRSLTIDPSELKYSNLISREMFAFGQMPGASLIEDPEDPERPGIEKYIPQLGDISIVSEEFDYTTTPVTIKLKLKIVDSTGATVKGIRGRIPPS